MASEDDGCLKSAIHGRERLFGEAQIAARQRFPSFRAPRRRIEQMSNGKSGAQNRAPSGVKREQSMRRGFVEPVRHLRNDFRSQRRSLKLSAFQAEIGQFVKGIDLAQFAIELQTIKDRDWIGEANMLGPKIAVAVHDMSQTNAGVVQKWPVLGNTDNKNPAARQGWF